VQLNATQLECKSKEFTLRGPDDTTFYSIYDKLQPALQIVADAVQHSIASALTFNQNGKVISVPYKLVSALFKFFVQGVEQNVPEQGG